MALNSHFELRHGLFDCENLQLAGFGLIELRWWPRLATLENIWHGDEHTQFDVAAGGGGAGLGLWPNGLWSLLVAIPSTVTVRGTNSGASIRERGSVPVEHPLSMPGRIVRRIV